MKKEYITPSLDIVIFDVDIRTDNSTTSPEMTMGWGDAFKESYE